ncbi:MAG: hypothetical protein ACPGNV_15000 [Mangrovicoccus sp.]
MRITSNDRDNLVITHHPVFMIPIFLSFFVVGGITIALGLFNKSYFIGVPGLAPCLMSLFGLGHLHVMRLEFAKDRGILHWRCRGVFWRDSIIVPLERLRGVQIQRMRQKSKQRGACRMRLIIFGNAPLNLTRNFNLANREPKIAKAIETWMAENGYELAHKSPILQKAPQLSPKAQYFIDNLPWPLSSLAKSGKSEARLSRAG